MAKDIWINLPVKDVNRSRTFFTELGFTLNPHHGNGDDSASFIVGEKGVVVMLFAEPTFKRFTGSDVADARKVSEILLSIGAESREEVDEWAKKAEKLGGTVFSRPDGHGGWMYGCGFADLDGHRWNVLYMDMSQMPKGPNA